MEKICKNCGHNFLITQADEAFLKKIGEASIAKRKIPLPTLCYECRQMRRLAWRNERYMYRRKCDFTGESIISMYPPDSPFKIYTQNIWWGDTWDALEYGRDFDFRRPFFEQFRELQLLVPRVALVNKQSENSEFTNHSGKNKNCFMSAVTFGSEDIYYSDWIMDHCRDLVDCSYLLEGCELCYETYYAWGSYRAFFCDFIKRCADTWFCYDCINCKDCFMCTNVRNKQYCIRNKQYSREAYEAEMAKIMPMSATRLNEFRQEYITLKKTQAIRPAIYELQSTDSLGDLLFHSKNCYFCFDSIKMEDCRFSFDGIDVKDSMDIYHVGWAELMYETHAVSYGYSYIACHFSYDNRNILYCDCVHNSQNLFGCAGLNRKKYCILNKQYSKEEYEALVPKIIDHMVETGEFGEFFPMTFSPFAFNQSRAEEYYPLKKDEAEAMGLRWSEYIAPMPQVTKRAPASEVPEYIQDTADDITDMAIVCEVSKKPFKIIKQELEFYRKTGLPLPRRHPDQRYKDRMAQRPPRQLWKRACKKCGRETYTSFPPEGTENVYCRECYTAEVA